MTMTHTTADEMEHFLILAYQAEEVAIGKAFHDILLPRLPVELRELTAFHDVPAASFDRMAFAFLDLSVEAGGMPAAYLAARGITPVHVAQAAWGLSCLASRTCDRAGEVSVALEHGIDAQLGRAEVDREVGMLTELPEPAAAALAGWVLAVACTVPTFLDKFTARRDGERLVLTWHGMDEDDIAIRWKI